MLPGRGLKHAHYQIITFSVCIFLFSSVVSGARCPWMCFCNAASKAVYCARRQLNYLPTSIPGESLQLNLNGNLFKTTSLVRANFSNFQSLQHLYLSECGIESLEVDTFKDLINLKWLDLSKNRIRLLEDYTFRGLSLFHLFLSGNRNLRVRKNAFRHMQTTGLYLNDCDLKKLPIECVAPLNTTLQKLWLNSNGLKQLDKTFRYMFPTLSHLRLGDNPFHCNCELLWLKELFDKSRGVFEGAGPPQCHSPHRLHEKKFDAITLFDFQCFPPVFINVDAHFDHGKVSLKCTASGDPPPVLFWIRPRGQSKKFTPLHTEGRRRNTAEWHITQTSAFEELSGQYICLALNEAGNVTLTMNMSLPPKAKPTTQVTHISSSAPASASQQTLYYKIYSSTVAGDVLDIHIPRTIHTPTLGYVTERKSLSINIKGENNSTSRERNSKTTEGSHPVDRLFTLVELVSAVAGTFACTLVICVVILPIYFIRKSRHRHHSLREKPPPPPSACSTRGDILYLPSMPDMEYMDSPNHVPKDNKPDLMEYLDGNYSTIK